MANILDLITVGSSQIYTVDADPSATGGTAAPTGSIAMWDNAGVGSSYLKTGAANTAWDKISTATSSGIAVGNFLRLPIYNTNASGNTIDDQVLQNAFTVEVAVAVQATRSVALTYTIPNPGDAVSAASFILSEGTQIINGSKSFTSSVDFGAQRAINIADPISAQDAATKNYVDAVAQGISWKKSVRAATTANITLSAPQTIDGVSVIAGDRVLVKNQTTASQNGVYIVAAGAWTRATDMDTGSEAVSASMYIDEGTLNADTAWVQTVNAPITIGTTGLVFVQFAGVGSYTAGNGLTLTGTQFSINLASASGLQFTGVALDTLLFGTTLSKSASGLQVATGGITNTEVAAAAAIARTKLASGTANHVLINDGSGVMSSEARLALSRTADAAINLVLVSQGVGVSPVYQAIVDAQIGASAAIARNKLAALTASKLMVTDASGFDSVSAGSGFLKATAGTPAFQASIGLTADVSGILPVANGGTNSATALSNNRIMVSSAGSIVENIALAAGRSIFTDANGLPAVSANYLWDNATSRLSIGGTNTTRTLDVTGAAIIRGAFKLVDAAGVANMEWTTGTVATTDATVTTLQSITVPTDTATLIETTIVCRRTGGTAGAAGDAGTYVRTSRFKNVAGTVTQFNLQSDYTSEDTAGFNAILDFTGTTARVRVTGAANTNLSWQCFSKVISQA